MRKEGKNFICLVFVFQLPDSLSRFAGRTRLNSHPLGREMLVHGSFHCFHFITSRIKHQYSCRLFSIVLKVNSFKKNRLVSLVFSNCPNQSNSWKLNPFHLFKFTTLWSTNKKGCPFNFGQPFCKL